MYVNPDQQLIPEDKEGHRKQTSGRDLLVGLDLTELTALTCQHTWMPGILGELGTTCLNIWNSSSLRGKWGALSRQLQAAASILVYIFLELRASWHCHPKAPG